MKVLVQYAAVAGGGAVGAVARYLIATTCAALFGSGFPVGTFVINITGSLFLGWFYAIATAGVPMSDTTRLAIATGFVGAYTTFSTYMYESDVLLRDGATIKALVNVIGSVVLGLLAVRVGVWLGAR